MLIQQRPLARTPRRRVNQATWATGRAVFSHCAAPRQARVVLVAAWYHALHIARIARYNQHVSNWTNSFYTCFVFLFVLLCFFFFVFCLISVNDFCAFFHFFRSSILASINVLCCGVTLDTFSARTHTHTHTHTLPRHSRSQIYGFT